MKLDGTTVVFSADEQEKFDVRPRMSDTEAVEVAVGYREAAKAMVGRAVSAMAPDDDPSQPIASREANKRMLRAVRLNRFSAAIEELCPGACVEAEMKRMSKEVNED